MIIDCISDLHGYYPKLDGGDLLIVAGDLTQIDTEIDTESDFLNFVYWTRNQEYKEIIVIAGNHDNYLQKHIHIEDIEDAGEFTYLCDSGTEFEGLKIWGSPWTKTFPGMNPHCKAFTCDTEEELAKKWALIPEDIDILITHSPPLGFLDEVQKYTSEGKCSECVGSRTLDLRTYYNMPKLQLHVFGHIHEHGGKTQKLKNIYDRYLCVNASHVNEFYEPINKPIRIEL